MNKSKAILITGGFGSVIFVAILVIFFSSGILNSNTNKTTNQEVKVENLPVTTTTNTTATPATTQPSNSTKYKNGVYSTNGEYNSPAGKESITVKLTIANDVVSASEVTNLATNPRSLRYQNDFKSGLTEKVVGKKLDDISVGDINGSSLTGEGFNLAVASIKNTAKA
jgi:Sec7-like guanine-nucleotide exchange factor